MDRVALEPPETLQLILQPHNAVSGDGTFCITDLDLVIEDADGKIIKDPKHCCFMVQA